MSYINELAQKTDEKIEQLKRQKILQENRQKTIEQKINTRRKIIIGELFEERFTDVLKLMPGLTKAADKIEFAGLEKFILELASNAENVERLKEMLKENQTIGK